MWFLVLAYLSAVGCRLSEAKCTDIAVRMPSRGRMCKSGYVCMRSGTVFYFSMHVSRVCLLCGLRRAAFVVVGSSRQLETRHGSRQGGEQRRMGQLWLAQKFLIFQRGGGGRRIQFLLSFATRRLTAHPLGDGAPLPLLKQSHHLLGGCSPRLIVVPYLNYYVLLVALSVSSLGRRDLQNFSYISGCFAGTLL